MNELIRKAEDIDADAIISLDYETDSIVPIEGSGLNSSAFSPQGSLSSLPAQRNAWSSKSCRLFNQDLT